MPVEQRLHLFGDWIEADVALDQDRVEAGDRSPGGRAGALKEPRQRGEDRWRIAATRGRFAGLAAALADQRDHDHIGVSAADDIAEQCGLAEPRRAEYSDALAAAAGQQAVDRRDAESDRTIDERARQRRWRLGIDRMKPLDLVVRPALSIQWLAQRVDNAPDEAGADRDPQLFPTRQHFSDVRQAPEIADGREDGDVFGKADHLGGHPALRRRIDQMAN